MHTSFLLIFLDYGSGWLLLIPFLFVLIVSMVYALIEAAYINKQVKHYSKTFQAALIANLVSSVAVTIIMLGIPYFAILAHFNTITEYTLPTEKGWSGFVGPVFNLFIFYIISVLVEIPIFNAMLKSFRLKLNGDVLIANGITFGLQLILLLLK